MKTIIVYYSFTHNNEKLASYLSEHLLCEKCRIETVKKRNGFSILLDLAFGRNPALKPLSLSIAAYDHVIFVSPVWAGKIASPLRAFIKREKPMIHTYSFITLCGGGKPDQKERIELELTLLTGKKPQSHLELPITDLLPLQQKDTVQHTSTYRVEIDELQLFEPRLQRFIDEHGLVYAG